MTSIPVQLPPHGNSVAVPVASFSPPHLPFSPSPPRKGGNAESDGEESESEKDESDDDSSPPVPSWTGGISSQSGSSMLQDLKPIVHVNFNDGYTIRHLFEMLKIAVPRAPMFFSQSGIEIERANGAGTLHVKAIFLRKRLIDYSFDESRCNDPKNKRHIIDFDLDDFLSQVKSIAKKEGLTLSHYQEYPDYVFGKPYGGNKSVDHVLYFKTQKHEFAQYDIKGVIDDTTLPNKAVRLDAFCNTCVNINRGKYPYSLFMIYPNGLKIISGNEIGSVGCQNGWGDCTGYVAKEKKSRFKVKGQSNVDRIEMVPIQPFMAYIPLDDTKALAKAANLHPSGIVEVYCETNQLLRLHMQVGSNCTLTMTLQGKDPNEILSLSSAPKARKKRVLKV
jgi:hypothetical protein